MLIEYGADVDVRNSESKTPLFVSIEADNPIAASTLLNFNADYRILSDRGTTALEHIKDIDEWIKLGYFDRQVTFILESKTRKIMST